jgi:transcriptional regulator with XRE-family HTH domain
MKKNFAARLKELRGSISQVEMARKLGTSQTSYSSWELEKKIPMATVVVSVANSFGVSADWLLGLSEHRDGAVQTVTDPALEQKVADLQAENARLKEELLRLKGENTGLNKALEMLTGRK